MTVVRTDGKPTVELEPIHPGGVFEGEIEGAELPLRYQLEVDYGDAGKFTIDDPYAFLPTLGELDQYLIGEGRHEELYEKLGAHIRGASTASPAPRSRCGRRRPARSASSATSTPGTAACTRCARSGSTGIWELFLPGVGPGDQLQVRDPAPRTISPAQGRPVRARDRGPAEDRLGRVRAGTHLECGGRANGWRPARAAQPALERPLSIYEVHLGSWRLNPLEGNRSLTYLELADELCRLRQGHGLHARRAACR